MRLIDADALKYTMLYKENFLRGTGVEALAVWKSDVDDMPTIDAVPVVRCRECIHSGRFYNTGSYIDCVYSQMLHEPDFYCKDGQRREDGYA